MTGTGPEETGRQGPSKSGNPSRPVLSSLFSSGTIPPATLFDTPEPDLRNGCPTSNARGLPFAPSSFLSWPRLQVSLTPPSRCRSTPLLWIDLVQDAISRVRTTGDLSRAARPPTQLPSQWVRPGVDRPAGLSNA